MAKEKAEKKEVNSLDGLDGLMKEINKKYGEGSVIVMQDGLRINDVERWSIEDPTISDILGGGIPKGRIIEIFGMESSGKTTLATYLSGEVQRQGGTVAYIDAEHSIDPIYAETLGLNVSKCMFNQPDYGEQALDIAEMLAKSGKVDLIVVDSVAALVPKAEIEGEMEQNQMGLQARMLGKFFRKTTGILNKNKCAIIFINQIRMKIGVMYGNPETTTGGLALKFYSSIRLDVRRGDSIDEGTGDNKLPIGIYCKIKNIKNKVGTPFKKGEVKVIFGKGIQIDEEYITFALKTEILERKGAWYFWDGVQLGCGMEKVIEYFKANPKMYEKLKNDTKARLNPSVNLDGSEIEEENENENKNEIIKSEVVSDESTTQFNSDNVSEVFEDKKESDEKVSEEIESEESETVSKVDDEKNSIEKTEVSIGGIKKRGRKPKEKEANESTNENKDTLEILDTDITDMSTIVPLTE